MMKNEVSLSDALERLASARIEHEKEDFSVDFTNWEEVRSRIFPRVVNKKMNQERVKANNLVKTDLNDDLMVMYSINVSDNFDESGIASTPVTNELLSMYKVSKEELNRVATENVQGSYDMVPLYDVIVEMALANGVPEEFLPESDEVPGLYILSNKNRVNGATALLDTQKLNDITDVVGDNFVVIPSSIHELLIASNSLVEEVGIENLTEVIGVVNNGSDMCSDEILSYRPYRYSKDKGLTIAEGCEVAA